MKKTVLGLIMLITFSNLYSELPYDSLFVIAESGLILRFKPNTNSQVITTIPFGTKVRRHFDNWIPDTINNRINYWMPVEYGKKKGYVWGLYLSQQPFVDISAINTDFRIIMEGAHCSQVGYSPDFHWYGIYKHQDSGFQEVRKVNIKIFFSQLLTKEEWHNLKSFDGDFLIKTDQLEKSIFLLGSKDELKTGKIQGYSFIDDYYGYDKTVFIYPEHPKAFRLNDNYCVTFMSRDIPFIVDSTKYSLGSKYILRITEGENNTAEYFDTKDFQQISNELDFMGRSAKIHSSKRNPTIIWYGDIDRDNKPDFIFAGHNMVEHGGIAGYWVLFISSSAIENNVSVIVIIPA